MANSDRELLVVVPLLLKCHNNLAHELLGANLELFLTLGNQSAAWAPAPLWSFLRLLSEWALLCECWEEAHLWSLGSLWELKLAHEFYPLFSSLIEKKQQKIVDSGTCSLSPNAAPRCTELCPLCRLYKDWLTNFTPQVLLGITLPLLRMTGLWGPNMILDSFCLSWTITNQTKSTTFLAWLFPIPPIVVQLLSCMKKISHFLRAGN